jgi:hypothetical protein
MYEVAIVAGVGEPTCRDIGTQVQCTGKVDSLGSTTFTILVSGHVGADRLHAPGHVPAPDANLGRAQPVAHDAHQVGQAGHQVPHARIHAGGVHPHQHLVVLGYRRVDVPQFQDIGCAVAP